MRSLFPPIDPFHQFHFRVSEIHSLYIEQCGNPKGRPVLFLHGGPGGGITPNHRRLFDPEHYHIILFDQRGAGKSTPHAELQDNSTWHLVSDMEKIRNHLGIQDWIVFGGSWGSTLALAYAQTHPSSVAGLILRGIFLCRRDEIQWFYQSGAHWIFPEVWKQYEEIISPEKRSDMVGAYYEILTGADHKLRAKAAKAWSLWEAATVKLIPDQKTIEHFTSDHTSLSLARIECHYFVNGSFLKTDDQLLKNVSAIKGIPGVIVHGRYDVVCPFKNAWDLSQVWPEAKLIPVDEAGHAYDEPGILNALISATDDFRKF